MRLSLLCAGSDSGQAVCHNLVCPPHNDIRQIIKHLPTKRQNLLFSATFSKEIRELANKLLDHPAEIQVAQRNTTADRVEQRAYPVDKARKRELLSEMIGRGNWQQVLVFTRTKHGANRLASTSLLECLTSGRFTALQDAADIASLNYELPEPRPWKSPQYEADPTLIAQDLDLARLDLQRLPIHQNAAGGRIDRPESQWQ